MDTQIGYNHVINDCTMNARLMHDENSPIVIAFVNCYMVAINRTCNALLLLPPYIISPLWMYMHPVHNHRGICSILYGIMYRFQSFEIGSS